MKAKKRLLLLVVVLAVFAVVSVTLANESIDDRTRNVITTGKVDITIKETSGAVNGKITQDGIEFTGVMPGNTTEKVVTITNEAETCWLRVKLEISVDGVPGGDAEITTLVVPNVDRSLWNLNDGYYYYKTALKKGDVASMFDQVLFAPTIGNEYAGKTVTMTVTAEATQYRNNETMSPDSWPDSGGGGTT